MNNLNSLTTTTQKMKNTNNKHVQLLIPASNRCRRWGTRSSFDGARFEVGVPRRKSGTHRNGGASPSLTFSSLCLSFFSFPFRAWSFPRSFCAAPLPGGGGGAWKTGRSRNRSRLRKRKKEKERESRVDDGASSFCHPFFRSYRGNTQTHDASNQIFASAREMIV